MKSLGWVIDPQSSYIYRAPQCISHRRNWDSPYPSPPSECKVCLPPSPRTTGWGGTHHTAKGLGESQFRRLEKKLSTLPTLCSLDGPWIFRHIYPFSKKDELTAFYIVEVTRRPSRATDLYAAFVLYTAPTPFLRMRVGFTHT
jgi:hypothetical protein